MMEFQWKKNGRVVASITSAHRKGCCANHQTGLHGAL